MQPATSLFTIGDFLVFISICMLAFFAIERMMLIRIERRQEQQRKDLDELNEEIKRHNKEYRRHIIREARIIASRINSDEQALKLARLVYLAYKDDLSLEEDHEMTDIITWFEGQVYPRLHLIK